MRAPIRSAVALAVVLAACATDQGPSGEPTTTPGSTAATGPTTTTVPPSRYFGNVPVVLDPVSVFAYDGQHIGEDSNLLALHIDGLGIPWLEFARGEDLPPTWLQGLDDIEQMVASVGHPVYLALSPLWIDRTRLAADAAAPFSPVGGPCLEDLPDWPDRRAGFKAYVEYMVDRFDPVFLAISIEVNSYIDNCPSAWPEVRSLLNEVYAGQKQVRPALPVFNTFSIGQMWRAADACHGFVETCIDEALAAVGDLSGDLFAVSTYPLIAYQANGEHLPEHWLSIFADRTGLPIAIAETGWQAASIDTQDPNDPGSCIEIPSSPEDQQWWMERLLHDADELAMPFVVWWADHDYLPLTVSRSCVCDDPGEPWCDFISRAANEADPTAFSLRFFAMMGLRDHDGAPRPSHTAWTAAVRQATP